LVSGLGEVASEDLSFKQQVEVGFALARGGLLRIQQRAGFAALRQAA
jgi:hypothetical protein